MPFDNKKQLLIIVGAVAAGIVAVVLTSNYVKTSIQGQTNALAEKYDAQQKDMANYLQQRSEQQAAALAQEIERVKDDDAAAMQKQTQELQATEQQQARIMQQQLQQQQPVQAKEALRKPSLAVKTPVGKRAVTVQINSLEAVGGLINAGDFVDVIAELNVPADDTDKKAVTAMIFQGLQVLAINTNEDDPGDYVAQQSATTLKITFAVDPQEAGLLAFANKNGTLELALRSPEESKHVMLKANTWKTLTDYVLKNQGIDIQNPDNEEASKPEESKPEIEIFRGGKEL